MQSIHRLAGPATRLVSSLVALALAGLLGVLVPLHMRNEPVQHLTLPNGDIEWVIDAAHAWPFIPDSQASCPSLVLLALLPTAWAAVVLLI